MVRLLYDRLTNLGQITTNTSMCSDAPIAIINMERTGLTSSSGNVQTVRAVRVDCYTNRGCRRRAIRCTERMGVEVCCVADWPVAHHSCVRRAQIEIGRDSALRCQYATRKSLGEVS